MKSNYQVGRRWLVFCSALPIVIPVFFAGVVFTGEFSPFRRTKLRFRCKYLGARFAGGLAQNISFIVGLKALLIVAIAVYIGAALFQSASKTLVRAFGNTA